MPTLQESSPRKVITHLTHIEDLVVTKQYRGAKEAEAFIKGLVKYFGGHADTSVNLTVKIDGAPAIVVGNDPDDGRFFIGTKGALAKTPRIAKSVEEINTLYDGKEGLISVMTTAFNALKDIHWVDILQGDVLFTPSLKQLRTIDGVAHVTFKPNTILYAVPLDTPLGQQIEVATFGVSFHTTYIGGSLPELVAKAGADVSRLRPTRDTVFVSNVYRDLSGTLTFTKGEMAELKQFLRDVDTRTRRMQSNLFVKMLANFQLLRDEFMMFQNLLIKQGKTITLSPKTFSKQFVLFLAGRQRELSAMKKTNKGMEGVSDRYKAIAKAVADSYDDVVEMLGWQQSVVAVKEFLLTKLEAPSKLGTFYETGEGVVAGPHEGFVASDKTGNFVKLVDRAVFSKINLTKGRFQTGV